MTREDRAVLTLQITAIALVALGLSYAGYYGRLAWRGVGQLAEAAPPEGTWGRVAVPGIELFQLAVAALACILLARPLARWFLLSGGPPATPAEEALRAAFFLTAVRFLRVTVICAGAVLYQMAEPGPLANRSGSFLATGILALATALLADRALAMRLARPRPGTRGLLAAGVLILCLTAWFANMASLSGALRTWVPPGPVRVPEPDLGMRRVIMAGILAGLFLAGLVAVLRSPLSRLGVLPRGDERAAAEGGELTPRAALLAAVGIAGAWLATPLVLRLAVACPLSLRGIDALGALLWLSVLPVAAMLAVSLGFGWLARRLFLGGEQRGPLPPRAVLAVDVGLTVVLVAGTVRRLCLPLVGTVHWTGGGLEWRPVEYVARAAPAIALIVLLLLRSDLTRAFCGWRGVPQPTQSERARVLQPWLFLLGVWLVLSRGPNVAHWAAIGLTLGYVRSLPDVSAVAGLVFMFAAGPLSRLLSYGPVIPRIWRPVAGKGDGR